MQIITRTVYGAALQTAHLYKLPLNIPENSTLNEKFGIRPTDPLEEGELPTVRYICIGNGGHRMTMGANNIPVTTPINHQATDAALYKHMPFVIRELDNDLSIVQRAKYAMRTIIKVDNVEFIAYYLKRLPLEDNTITLSRTHIANGEPVTVEFVPNNDNLNPEPPELPHDHIVTTDGSYISCSSVIDFQFTAQDVEELINVARVLYNDEAHAIISEIGLCSGVDRTITEPVPGGNISYREALRTQIVTHISTHYPVGLVNDGFRLQLEAGAVEPLLGIVD